MKLYQFTYIDNEKLNESALLSRVASFLENEALFQGWSPGYTFRQCQAPVRIPDGGMQYYYEVNGKFFDSEDLEDNNQPRGESKSGRHIAAKEAEL